MTRMGPVPAPRETGPVSEPGRALTLAVTAVYGPFFAAAVVTWVFVDCDHCKRAWLEILGVAPGLIAVTIASRVGFGSMPAPSLGTGLVSEALVSLAIVGLVAWLARRGGRFSGWIPWFASGVMSSWGAWGLYSLVRA